MYDKLTVLLDVENLHCRVEDIEALMRTAPHVRFVQMPLFTEGQWMPLMVDVHVTKGHAKEAASSLLALIDVLDVRF